MSDYKTDRQVPSTLIVAVEDYKKKPTYQVTLASDTEYKSIPNHPTKMITTQLAWNQQNCLVLEHPSFGLNRLESWYGQSIFSTVLGLPETTLPLGKEPDGYLTIELLMFFAPNDAFRGLFRDRVDILRIQDHCLQDARIRIKNKDDKNKATQNRLPVGLYVVKDGQVLELVLMIKDLGKLAVGGLQKTAEGMGIEMLDKSSMDGMKAKMDEAYATDDIGAFDIFINYSKSDATVLFDLREANLERIKTIFGVHKLPVPKEILTTGSLVAQLLKSYIKQQAGLDTEVLGDVCNDSGDYLILPTALDAFAKANGKETYRIETLLAKSSVSQFAKSYPNSTNNTRALLGLLSGGRAKYETPLTLSSHGCIGDIDLSSAYANIIKLLTFPVGIPSTYGIFADRGTDYKPLTLGRWLARHKPFLQDRLWHVVVTGDLEHEQDLIASKVIDYTEILVKYNPDDCKIVADFRLYLKQIKNGVISSDILEVLKNVCTRSEYKEYMGLKVEAAIWYDTRYRCSTAQEWNQKTIEHVDATGGGMVEEIHKDGSKTFTEDNRSKYWLAVPLDKFIQPYMTARTDIKDLMKLETKGSKKYNELHAQQDAMKLVCNVCYGVIASPFFDIGNVTLGNNITAIARAEVWMTAKALGLYQTITDGGAGSINHVRTWKTHKPSMDVLAKFRDMNLLSQSTRYQQGTKPLGSDTNWILESVDKEYSKVSNGSMEMVGKDGTWKYFDKAAIEHLRYYFRSELNPISLLAIDPETKLSPIVFEYKDMYKTFVGHGQTNYRLTMANGIKKDKARGHKLKDNPYIDDDDKPTSSEILQLFSDIETRPNNIPAYHPLRIESILKCNQANAMGKVGAKDNTYKKNELVAGDSIYKSSWLRPLSLSMFHWLNHKQYLAWTKNHDALKERYGYGLELFYLDDYEDNNLRYEDMINAIATAINNNLKPDKLFKIEPTTKHPFMTEDI